MTDHWTLVRCLECGAVSWTENDLRESYGCGGQRDEPHGPTQSFDVVEADFDVEALRAERDEARKEVERLRAVLTNPCGCKRECGDDGDTEGPGVCKGLPGSMAASSEHQLRLRVSEAEQSRDQLREALRVALDVVALLAPRMKDRSLTAAVERARAAAREALGEKD